MSAALTQAETRAAPSALRTDTLADTVVILLALTAVQRVVGFVRGVLFCRWLDPLELGEWDMAFGFLLLASPLIVLGLPGTFGRYVERYRQQGQLRPFLARMALLSTCLMTLGVTTMALAGTWVSELVFGRPDRVELVRLIAACLAIVVTHNFLMELFTALRMARLVSTLHFIHSLAFAGIGTALIVGWHATAASVVLAYGAASLLCVLGSLVHLRRVWRAAEAPASALSHQSLLARLLPFALWIWLASWLANMFDMADRYMLVHYSGLQAAEALAQVGNYHSSRVVPMLLVSVAALLAGVALPHISHDWEAGRRDVVSQRVNLMLKLTGFCLLAGAAIIQLAAPLLFEHAFQGKYSGGLSVFPWTLAYCVWFGLIGTVQNYLWCAEKARLVSLAMLAGLVINVCLNLVLLPPLGLLGAVLATAAANLAAFALTCLFAHLCGLRVDPGMWIITLLPPVLPLGPWTMLGVLALFALWAVFGKGLLSEEDRQQLAATWRRWQLAGMRIGLTARS